MQESKVPESGAQELDHPCKQTCSGWRQGFEQGTKECPRCGDMFYHPKTIIEDLKQRAAEWEDIAKTKESLLRAAVADARAKAFEGAANLIRKFPRCTQDTMIANYEVLAQRAREGEGNAGE